MTLVKIRAVIVSLSVNSDKDLDQVKTKTRSLEKDIEDIKARMNRTGEEGSSRIKEKWKEPKMLLINISLTDGIDPSKIKVLSSNFESNSANESFGVLTDESEFECPLTQMETQSKSTIQIRKKSIVESDDK